MVCLPMVSDQIIPHADDPDDLLFPTLVIINGVEIKESIKVKQELLNLLKDQKYLEFERHTGISTDY